MPIATVVIRSPPTDRDQSDFPSNRIAIKQKQQQKVKVKL